MARLTFAMYPSSQAMVLENELQVSAIHTRSSQEQVKLLLRDLRAAEAAAVAKEAVESGTGTALTPTVRFFLNRTMMSTYNVECPFIFFSDALILCHDP